MYRKCTKDNTVKELQFKILHQYVPTNKLLFQMGKVASNKCTFCEMYIDTIEHMFYTCHVVRDIWIEIEQRLCAAANLKINLSVSDVLLCCNMKSKDAFSVQNININTVILYVKQYIWHCKSVSITPSKHGLLEYLENNIMYIPCLSNVCN